MSRFQASNNFQILDGNHSKEFMKMRGDNSSVRVQGSDVKVWTRNEIQIQIVVGKFKLLFSHAA